MNTHVIALNQDPLGKQAVRVIDTSQWNVFVKPLAGGDTAIAILNRGDTRSSYAIDFKALGLKGGFSRQDLWQQTRPQTGWVTSMTGWKGIVEAHETKVFRLTPASQSDHAPEHR